MKKITLKAARVNAGLTQTEAAEKIGVSATTIQNWESGKKDLRYSHFLKACEVYDMDPEQIFLTCN